LFVKVVVLVPFYSGKKMNLNEYVDDLVNLILKKINHGVSSQLQCAIHPDILFRYNTINLLVARRGVGRTLQ
jgi:hypothetical protein